jgi:hypothetical protein
MAYMLLKNAFWDALFETFLELENFEIFLRKSSNLLEKLQKFVQVKLEI